MGGGLMQLVAYGAQDIYLTGNPQITFFKVVYRRHTNFAMEAVQQTLNGTTSSVSKQTAVISRNGDLVGKTFITMKDGTFGMREGEIYDLISSVEIQIGGQRIDQQYGDWNAIWWELTTPSEQVNALRAMMIENAGAVDGANAGAYYPLNFWFCRNPGLALPLIALQYHEVKLIINWGTVPTSGTAGLWCDYIYLDTDERRRFAQVSHEYLIEQVQRQTFTANASTFTLNLNHPVKELIWVNSGSSDGYAAGCQFMPIRNTSGTTSGTVYVPADNDDEATVKLQLNGHDRFTERDSKYFRYVQPNSHHTRCPAPVRKIIQSHHGGGPAIDDNANGTALQYMARTSRVTSATLHITTLSGQTDQEYTLNQGTLADPDAIAMSGETSAITNAAQDITFTGGAASATNGLINHNYTAIVPAGSYVGVEKSTGTAGNATGYLTLEVDELPTLIVGDKANHSEIYCYSFALKPEEHQPSGTCNFSRIDNAKLIFSANAGGATNSLKVFATNYNVLRIMSGMAGLAYSN